jgi:hypothetical protein
LSVGWGIRGNFGHEFGAMIPGALAAMAAVLLSGRDDWSRRIAYFGFFGALGWSFGGSISYMQVIAYTHSGHPMSVLYGFACLFVIGFLWAAMGGAGTALPACVTHEELGEFFPPLTAVFVAWCVQDIVVDWLAATDPQFRQASPLYWYDTDWLGVLVAIAAVLGLALVRRRIDPASALMLHMAIGWWAGFLILVVGLGWRMTPPHGDNWAGCVGMVLGMWVWLQRRGWHGVTAASLVSGFVGGFGFATATMLKLVEVKTGWQTNWHSILEQTYGLINGIGIAIAMICLARETPATKNEPQTRRWTGPYAVIFLMLVVTYLNLRKNPEVWVKAGAVPAALYGLSVETWFNIGYALVACVFIGLVVTHRRRGIPLVPATDLGRGQLLYLAFLWWMVVGNFERALVSFAPQRLVTEGVILINAALCTALVLLGTPALERFAQPTRVHHRWFIRRIGVGGLAAAALIVLVDWGVVRAVWGNQFAGYAGLHIRFGPNATATKAKPPPDKPHP